MYMFTLTVVFPLTIYIIGFEIQEEGPIDNENLLRTLRPLSQSSRGTEFSENRWRMNLRSASAWLFIILESYMELLKFIWII